MNGHEKLQRCLRPLSKHIQILCASGDAAFDQLRPNEDEIEDQTSCLDDPTLKTNQTYFFETRTHPQGNGNLRERLRSIEQKSISFGISLMARSTDGL